MSNALYVLLSQDWAGLVIALAVALVGGASWWWGNRAGGRWRRRSGLGVLVVAALLAAGAIVHIVRVAGARADHPPPGELVDMGGYRIHVLAEGEARGRPTVVWLPGGHSAGLYVHHLHEGLAREARSVLIDRPGTGWSDVGPFPRSTALEAEEIVEVLERAGERPPFVLAGHSFGGLLVANVARRHPELTAAVVLLDPTPPDTIIYAPHNPVLGSMRAGILASAVVSLFGIGEAMLAGAGSAETDPEVTQILRLMEERLGSELIASLRAIESGTRARVATASIFAELSPEGMAARGWDTVVYDGDLGDLPLYLVTPGDMGDAEAFFRTMAEANDAAGEQRFEQRLRRFYELTRQRYLAASSRSERIVTPAGTGHNFPYETPEFVIDVIRRVLDETHQAPAPP
ncbi:MAG: alpha/beta hydrolase [Gammaproteobacteria bacterium]|nr:alpha/beta hydrolase [Gammaproteobacteria bacterium]